MRLWTPYGVVVSRLVAVSSSVGKVGHDRVQSRGRAPSIADQIAHWYSLNTNDIERIEFEDSFDADSFVIRPSKIKFFGRRSRVTVYPNSHPLTLVEGHQAPLLTEHVRSVAKSPHADREWIAGQICSLVDEHRRPGRDLDERDLLRASGALDKLGTKLGMYRSKGIDCPDASFVFDGLPPYPCPIEVEQRSSGLLVPHHKDHRRGRIVVLCMEHDSPETLRGYVDVIELRELCRLLRQVA